MVIAPQWQNDFQSVNIEHTHHTLHTYSGFALGLLWW